MQHRSHHSAEFKAKVALAAISRNTDEIVCSRAGDAVTHSVRFKVVEVRPLV